MAIYEMTTKLEIPEGFGDFQVVESKIVEACREAGRSLMQKVFLDYEAQVIEKRPVQKKDQREKTYETLVGKISLKRWRVRDVFKKKYFYPVDAWMGIKGHQRVSPGLTEAIMEQAVMRPYGQATKVCEKLTGFKRSVMGNWKLVQGVGMKRREAVPRSPDWKEKSLPVLLPDKPDPCPILGVDPDATYVRPRRKSDTNHELKMAVLYTHRKKKGKKRWELLGKQVVLGSVREGAPDLFCRVTEKAVSEYGLHSRSRVIVHGDGDPWIKQFGHYCPQTLLRLDPYHVFKKIREATDVEEIPKDWIADFYQNPRSLIGKVEALGKEMADQKDRERIDQLIGYLRNNEEGMRRSGVSKAVKKQFPRMYLRGSGTVESNVFQMICQRFKAPRMMWSKEGLNNLSHLRQEYLNRSFDFKKTILPREHCKRQTAMDELREVARDLEKDHPPPSPLPSREGE